MIRLDNVCRFYHNGEIETRALLNINFEIINGEFVVIAGPSGSGKSTLLHILGCLDNPTSGEYYLEDVPVNNLSKRERAIIRNKKMGFIFQSFNLIPELTVFENLELPLIYCGVTKKERIKIITKNLERVSLDHRKDFMVDQLSGGEQQRVAIARSLVVNPVVLFADEPTGNLDTKTGNGIMELLKELNEKEKMTVVMVTHNENHFKFGNRIIHIKDGQLIEN